MVRRRSHAIPGSLSGPTLDRASWLRVLLCLALAAVVGLAAPAASLTWLNGGHATAGHIALHEQELARGNPLHHPGAALEPQVTSETHADPPATSHTGHTVEHAAQTNPCEEGGSRSVLPGNPYIHPGSAASVAPSESMRAALGHLTQGADCELSRQLIAPQSLSFEQQYPSPPHRPPIL